MVSDQITNICLVLMQTEIFKCKHYKIKQWDGILTNLELYKEIIFGRGN